MTRRLTVAYGDNRQRITGGQHVNIQRKNVEDALGRHGQRIMHLAWTYLHNRADAEDVLQETMIRYIRSQKTFRDEEHEKAWLLQVTANLCKNILRSRAHEGGEIPENLEGKGIPEEAIAVYEAVQSLPEKYREVVHLFYYEDASVAEIAAILGKKESTVRSLLKRARKLLEKLLNDEES